ncbi:MAG: hypothetical protein C5B53_11290 [Candidatus Melainabacteria bacterium]|nr:MAG: hypothetical protein C5B53_11290 [Candidatus Melainabacteria bacterium]
MDANPSTPPNAAQVTGILLWSLLPCLAIWVGVYIIGSAVWAYFLYHGLCLLPAIIWGRTLWQESLRLPTPKQLALLFLLAIFFSTVAVGGYELIGRKLLSDEQTLLLMKQQGWFGNLFWPISIYAVVVNPVVEELFWRGVVLNAVDAIKFPVKHFGIIWSSLVYAAFHYGIFRLVLFPGYAEVGIFVLALYGAFLAIVYRKTGSIITTAITHGLLTDTAALMLMLDLFRRHPNFM